MKPKFSKYKKLISLQLEELIADNALGQRAQKTVELDHWNSLGSRSILLNSLLIPKNRENPPSPNELLSKGWILADITASAKASDKTAVCITLKQRSNSGNYGELLYLGKRMAVLSDK